MAKTNWTLPIISYTKYNTKLQSLRSIWSIYRGIIAKLSLLIRSSAITPPPDEVPRIRHTLIPAGGVSAAKPKRKRGQKGGEGEGRGIRDECTRKEWKTEGKGGGREEGSTPRYCTRLHGCAHNRTGPRKTPFQVRSPPWKTYFLLFVARARSDRIHWIPPIPIFRAPIFRNTCHAFTSSLV